MKKLATLKAKKLTRETLKTVAGGIYVPKDEDDGCAWNMCRNAFGRCSVFACPGSI
ncbi:hypothetical protein [Chryseobacterium chendengshani]|uniref:hypothetical protein n=1 Tax=unclassified Chryseobacterium TaxID=2593645 RepID=UPI001C642825|nr:MULTISPECIES: hypothetical protein [unclassified Chryseobacterium]MBW7675257.1 hypothetical protein [Chryseobacterium sp. LJ756]MBW8522194.1 hypothetical protein [Chryseobacterium sp. LJ668]QYK17838.1 hypothetical protein K0U91_06895 [Chryseobacterium sp. LJ668]